MISKFFHFQHTLLILDKFFLKYEGGGRGQIDLHQEKLPSEGPAILELGWNFVPRLIQTPAVLWLWLFFFFFDSEILVLEKLVLNCWNFYKFLFNFF